MARQLEKLAKADAAFHIAKSSSDHDLAYRLAKDICRSATRYRFPQFAISSAEYLVLHYTLFDFARKKALRYKEVKNQSINDFLVEMKMRDFSNEILLCERSSHFRKDTDKALHNAWEYGRKHLNKVNSIEFHRIAYHSGCRHYAYNKDWNSVLLIASQAIDHLRKYELPSKPTLSWFYRYLLEAKMSKNDLDLNDSLLIEYNNLFSKPTINWFNYRYLLTRYFLQNLNHIEARKLHKATTNKAAFNKIPDHNKWSWKVANAYIQYVEICNIKDFKQPRIRLGKFINSTEDFQITSKEEQYQLRLIQLLYFLIDKKWDHITDRAESMLKFLDRSGIKKADKRSYLFAKMVVEIPKHQFHPVAIQRHTSNYFRKLKSEYALVTNINSRNFEIIPYERLWEMIMENLKR